MFTKLFALIVLSSGLLFVGPTDNVSRPTCCAKGAYCCTMKLDCCRHGEATAAASTEVAVATKVATGGADVNRPTCCAKSAYCCSMGANCCR